MSARGKRGSSVKVSFFAFQDIITCVSGILLIVTLLMTTMITDDAPTPGGGAPDPAQELTQLQQALETAKQAIAALTGQVAQMPDRGALEAATKDLREKLAAAQAAAEEARAMGATIQVAEMRLAELEVRKRNLAGNVEKLTKEVQDREVRALQAANEWRLVPNLPSNSRTPVMVVVSESSATLEELNRPASRTRLDKAALTAGFAAALQKYDPSLHYFIFYIKPSGITNFAALKEQAKQRHFAVGFDALLENIELTFSKPAP
jgi:hypothetical protein